MQQNTLKDSCFNCIIEKYHCDLIYANFSIFNSCFISYKIKLKFLNHGHRGKEQTRRVRNEVTNIRDGIKNSLII